MHPTYNAGRRRHHARLLTARHARDPEACNTAAASYRFLHAHAAAIVAVKDTTLATAKFLTGSTCAAEEAAIALVLMYALTCTACRGEHHLPSSCHPPTTTRTATDPQCIDLSPYSHIGNEVAHATSSDLTHREFSEVEEDEPLSGPAV